MLCLNIPVGGGIRIGDTVSKVDRVSRNKVRLVFDADRTLAIQRGRHVIQVGKRLVIESETEESQQ